MANTGSVSTVTLNCNGLSPDRKRLLASIPALLNKLLASQADNSAEILSKLDTCIVQTAPRHVSDKQAAGLKDALSAYSGRHITVDVYTMERESNDFGLEAVKALEGAGLVVGVTQTMGASLPVKGCQLQLANKDVTLVPVFAKALVEAGICNKPIPYQLGDSPMVANGPVLTIGYKP